MRGNDTIKVATGNSADGILKTSHQHAGPPNLFRSPES